MSHQSMINYQMKGSDTKCYGKKAISEYLLTASCRPMAAKQAKYFSGPLPLFLHLMLF